MKKIVFLFLIFANYLSYSQDFNTVYYNENWEMTSMKSGKYFRNSGFNSESLSFDSIVVDHYMDGIIEMTGRYSSGLKYGEFIYYYPDHSVRLISNYDKNKRNGLWTSYFGNGQINKVVEYKDNKERILKYFNDEGKSLLKNMNGKFSLELYYDFQYNSLTQSRNSDQCVKYDIKGSIKDGYKDGTWIIRRFRKVSSRINENNWVTNEVPGDIYKARYEKGNFISGIHYSNDGEKQKMLSDTLSCLIPEPGKITITESLFSEPGQLIKQNYIIKAVLDKEKRDAKEIVLDDESDIPDFFNANFTVYTKNCSDTTRMIISLRFDDQNKVIVNSLNPKVSSSFEKEVYRVINKISKIKIHSVSDYTFTYRIQCLNELDFKK